MYYEFYLDVYILENLVMNYAVLRMTGILWRECCKRRRLFAAALIGAVLSALAVVFRLYAGPWRTVFLNLALELGMTAAGFPKSTLEKWIYKAITFCLLSLLAEGSWQIVRGYLNVSFPFSMAGGILLPFLLIEKALGRWRSSRFLCRVSIILHGNQKTVTALWDSGNQLAVPFTGQPVHIIDYQVIRELLTKEEDEELCRMMELCPGQQTSGLFGMIPYRSIGKENGLLPVLKLEGIRIEKDEGITDTPDTLAAVSRRPISQAGAYQMILHP